MAAFHLYRLTIVHPIRKIKFPNQEELFHPEDEKEKQSPGEIILSAIEEKPSQEIGRGQTWRIGNIQKFHEKKQKVFFAIGKVTKATRESYDEEKGDFIEEEGPDTHHTHVAIDLELQVCAIAQKTKIASDTRTTANKLAGLLNASQGAKINSVIFKLDKILDPEEFLDLIKSAESIANFEMTLGRPNPVDADELIQKPGERYVSAINGKQAKISVTAEKGETLKADVIEDCTRSATLRGCQVTALIKFEGDEKPSRKKLEGNSVVIQITGPLTEESIPSIFEKIAKAYHDVLDKES